MISLSSTSSSRNFSSDSVSSEKPQKIVKNKLEVFDLLKRLEVINTDPKDSEAPYFKSCLDFHNFYAKLAVKVVYWVPFCITTLDLVAKVSDIIAQELTYNCNYPPWSIGISVTASVGSAAVGVLGTKMSYDIDKKNKRQRLIHEKEVEEANFAQFTAAFDNYKKQVEELFAQNCSKQCDRKTDASDDDLQESDSDENKKVDESIEKPDEKLILLERALHECIEKLNNCSETQQNKLFSREMWLSQLIYLLNKALKSIEKMKDDEEKGLKKSAQKTPSIIKLMNKVEKNADVLKKSSKNSQILTNSEKQTRDTFKGEMASHLQNEHLGKSFRKHERRKAKFEKTWKRLEKVCGPIDYLATNKKIVGSDGKIYSSEEEIFLNALKENAAPMEEIVLDIND